MQQETTRRRRRKRQAIEQVRNGMFQCMSNIYISTGKTQRAKEFQHCSTFINYLVVLHTSLDDDNNPLMSMEQKQFEVIVMHSMHLMQRDYHRNLVA